MDDFDFNFDAPPSNEYYAPPSNEYYSSPEPDAYANYTEPNYTYLSDNAPVPSYDYAPSYGQNPSGAQQGSAEASTPASEGEASWGREGRTSGYEPEAKPEEGALSKIAGSMGLSGDITNPKTLDNWMKLLMGAGSLINTLHRKGTAQNGQTPRQARDAMPGSEFQRFNAPQQAWSNQYFNTSGVDWQNRARTPAAAMKSPIVAGRGYAGGGEVMGGALPQKHGFEGYVQGPGGGQDDLIDARLAAGEYVFDADVVSALGDGDNAQGAAILDQFRESLRAHKRSADPSSIPPQALSPEQYMPQGALTQMSEGAA